MQWIDYLVQFALTMSAVIIGYAMGRTIKEDIKYDSNNSRPSRSRDDQNG